MDGAGQVTVVGGGRCGPGGEGASLDGGVVVPENVVEDEGEDLVGIAHHVERRGRHPLQDLARLLREDETEGEHVGEGR